MNLHINMKLHELHINDFKFFSKVEPDSPLLKINGNHLLIYGENGSGKSTIYWSLYTLLECSFKNKDEDIRKYFKKTGDESLVNIHAIGSIDSYIKAVVKDTLGGSNSFKASRKTSDLSIRENMDVRESNMASDFINYRVLFQLHSSKNSKNNNLWNWFYEEVLPYVKRGSDPCLEEYGIIKKGPTKVRNLVGDDIFPTASLRTANAIEERRLYRSYKDYKNKWNAWMNWLATFLSNITDRANELIEDDFKYKLKINLSLKSKFPEFNPADSEINWFVPKINISIPEYEGVQNPKIKKPHTFFNEAKWSAIGLAMRFAVLETRLYTAEMKVLVIDDMLLSLDMRNRNVVLNLLLKKYSQDYQLLLMTHDKSFYELGKKKINILGQKKDWNFIEMYEDSTGNFPKPYFKPSKNNLQNAQDYLTQHDYAACGIYLRKEIERKLDELLPVKYKKEEKTEDGVTTWVNKNLNDLIIAFKMFCSTEEVDYLPFTDLKTYKDLLLNPLAHNDVDASFFRDELNSLIKIAKELNKVKRGRLFYSSNKNMNFTLNKADGSSFSVRMKSAEQIVLIEEEGKQARISIHSKCKVSGIDNNGVITTEIEQFDTIRECYDEMCSRFGIASTNNLSTLFNYNGKNFTDILTEINSR
jgi:ABC-type dipeptide/oligopeptide/nickel transport system ATPase subunit